MKGQARSTGWRIEMKSRQVGQWGNVVEVQVRRQREEDKQVTSVLEEEDVIKVRGS